MAKVKSGVNRSKAIRELLEQNFKTPVKEIIATLAAKGITVKPPLVYFVKTRMKKRKRRQVREKVATVVSNYSALNPVALIRQVKALATEVGGLGKLKQLVEALGD